MFAQMKDRLVTRQSFYRLLNDTDEPLWDGCTTHTKLSAVAQILNIKSEAGTSEDGYNRIIDWARGLLPEGNRLKENYYAANAMVKPLGLGYEKIEMCPGFCMLYYGDDILATSCKVCKHERYQERTNDRSCPVAFKTLRYFPITPRLQRFYMSTKIASHMTWHKTHNMSDGSMVHPSDGEAWKHFNATHPKFDAEARNVRLGLCSDGFNSFGMSVAPYSCWLVMTTVYNLPPGMCMKKEFIFLSMVIPGPHNPKQSIDVCLRPLIDELNRLWTDGVMTFDISKKQIFLLKAALMWTINDFPTYGMLSGWSTHGKLSCPYCMGDTKSFTLKYGGKVCFFDCHRRFLPPTHRFRTSRKDFIKGRVEKDLAPTIVSGTDLYNVVSQFGDVVFGLKSPKKKFQGFGVNHNWVKKSIFWKLPYWKTNRLRHNLDVMHIEKNVFDNIFNTAMDVKEKTKDNVKSIMDLLLHCDRQNLELQADGRRVVKPKAAFTLKKGGEGFVLKSLKTLRFPDGYASNIGRCVNLEAVMPPPWIPDECWKPIAIAWDDPKFKKNRLIASQNRRTVTGNCLSKHIRGLVCFVGHADRMESQTVVRPDWIQVFDETRKSTKTIPGVVEEGDYIDEKSRIFAVSTGPDRGRYYGLPQVESARKIPRGEGVVRQGGGVRRTSVWTCRRSNT